MTGFVSQPEPRRPASPRALRVHLCRWPGCTRQISPRRWGCAQHWHNLPPDLQNRLARAARFEGRKGRPWFAPQQPSQALLAVLREAQDWIAARLARGRAADRRQPELDL